MPAARDISTTFLKGLDVLRAYGEGARGLTLAELSRRTGHDRATVRRLCLTLVEAGFMTRDGRAFSLSPRVLTLAGGFLKANEVGFSVQPVLNAHARLPGRELGLAVLDGDRALLVAQSAPVEARITFGLTVGSTLPLLPTAIGRMLLAVLPGSQRAALIARLPLERWTGETCLDRDEIARRVVETARAGAATVMGEYEAGICGLAVPVGPPGRARCVLGATLPMHSPDFERCRSEALGGLHRAAAELAGLRALETW